MRTLLSCLIRAEDDFAGVAERDRGSAVEEGGELGFIPVSGELVGDADDELTSRKVNWHSRFQPCSEHLFRHVSSHKFQEALPGLCCGQVHADVEKVGRANVGTVCGKVNSSRMQATANPLTYNA